MFRRSVLLSLVSLSAGAPAAALAADGLPQVGSGHRPGPDALYAGPPRDVPQLENAGVWTAKPILVSGATAYRDGEWLWQDFILDDHGAIGTRARNDPSSPLGDFLFSPTSGTFVYPENAVYANNAADIVEVRVKPLADATAIRVTLNTLKDAGKTGVTIALGKPDAESRDWPHGAGISSPADVFLTWHGNTAELTDAATGAAKTPAPTVDVNLERRQIDLRIPKGAYDPGTGKVELTAGAGLWNAAAKAYLKPNGGNATETTPGGVRPSGPAIVNVGPRLHAQEPLPDVSSKKGGVTIADAAAGALVDGSWWRERAQSVALADGDVSQFSTEIDFGKLAAGTDDESGVPKDGPINRILASRYVFGQGIDHTRVCFDIAGGINLGAKCIGRQVGQLQPYTLYVPRKPQPADGYGLTLLLHSLSANYNQYSASRNQSQLGERGAGSLVITPAGRGPDGFYAGVAEADTFEVWADVARHYKVDADWVSVSGYSMGGFGTYRLLARYPDLFARGFPVVSTAGSVSDQLPSLRNTPILDWAASADELVNIAETEENIARLEEAGVRFIHDLFLAADHLTLATNDEYGPGAEFLGEHRVDRAPHHVTYVVDADEDNAETQTVADHAYWTSGLELRDDKALGTLDARSDAFGRGDEPPLPVDESAGMLEGGSRGPTPYHRRELEWAEGKTFAPADRLIIRARNLTGATIDTKRAKLSCAPAVDLQADGPFHLRLDCPAPPVKGGSGSGGGTVEPQSCRRTVRIALPRVQGRRITRVVVSRRGKALKRLRGRNVRSVVVRRPTRRAFAVRVRATMTSKGKKTRRITIKRRFRACG